MGINNKILFIMDINEAIKISDIISKIKGIPNDILDFFKKKPETVEIFDKYLILLSDNPPHNYQSPQDKESKRIFDDFLNGLHISEEDQKMFMDNFKKFAKETGNFVFGFSLGLFPVFAAFMTIFEFLYAVNVFLKQPAIANKLQQRHQVRMENFKNNHPELWKLILKYKEWKNTDNPKWSYTDEPETGNRVEPTIKKESAGILGYNEFKEKINEEFINEFASPLTGWPLASAMGPAAFFGFGAGVLLNIYLGIELKKKRIQTLYDKAKVEGADPKELKKYKNDLDWLSARKVNAIYKIKKKQEELKKKNKKLSDLPKEKQELAKKLAAEYQTKLEKLKTKEKKFDLNL